MQTCRIGTVLFRKELGLLVFNVAGPNGRRWRARVSVQDMDVVGTHPFGQVLFRCMLLKTMS